MSSAEKRSPASSPPAMHRRYGNAFTVAPKPGTGRTFSCPHLSVSNALSAWCEQCGELQVTA